MVHRNGERILNRKNPVQVSQSYNDTPLVLILVLSSYQNFSHLLNKKNLGTPLGGTHHEDVEDLTEPDQVCFHLKSILFVRRGTRRFQHPTWSIQPW
jgi:hypothetical protein